MSMRPAAALKFSYSSSPSVLYLRMLQEVFRGAYYLRYSCLVVRAQESVASGYYEPLTLIFSEERKVRGAYDAVLLLYVSALILYYLRFYVLSGCVRRGVHVGDEAYAGRVPAALACRDKAVNIAVVIHPDFGKAYCLKLLLKMLRQLQLPCRRRHSAALLIRRRPVRHIFKKPFGKSSVVAITIHRDPPFRAF